jgi:adenine-specific DNA-methyltransferase
MTEKVKELDGASLDPIADKLAQLRELLPEAFAEDKIDFEKLKAALGQEIELGERYGLAWKGKSQVFRAIQEPTTKTLRPDRDNSINFDESQNIFIEGDNLEALKILQKGYYGKVKMIYIDPPYNTGNDFVYNDKFAQTRTSYEQEAGLRDDDGNVTAVNALQRNSRDGGHFHSNWLNMMYPRLYVARSLLRQDGVIFVSIDDNEVHNLRLIMNEIFGEENFIAQITAQLNPRGRNLDEFVARTHEYVLIYARDASLEGVLAKLPKTIEMLDEYDKQDDDGKRYRLIELRNRNPAFNKVTRPKLYYPVYVDPSNGSVSTVKDDRYHVEAWPTDSTGGSTCWTWNKEKFEKDRVLLLSRQTKDGVWRVFRKDYLEDSEGNLATTLPKSVWLENEINHDYGKKSVKDHFNENLMSFPKSPYFIEKMVRLGATKDSIVLDFFGGSGTTAEAVMRLNAEDGGSRKWIVVQLDEEADEASAARKAGFKTIADLARERIRRAGEKIAKESKANHIDTGFKAFEVNLTNFKVWDSTVKDAHKLEQQMQAMFDPIRKDSKEEDLLVELILKSGIPLTATRQRIDINGQAYWQIADNEMLICLSEHLSKEMLEDILAKRPAKLIILNRSLADDVYKANAILQLQGLQIDFQVI